MSDRITTALAWSNWALSVAFAGLGLLLMFVSALGNSVATVGAALGVLT